MKAIFERIGFSKNEAKALVVLLQHRELTAQKLATNAKIPNTKIYKILDRLIKRGAIEKIRESPEKTFSIIDPFVWSQDIIRNKQKELAEVYKLCELITYTKLGKIKKKISTWTLDWSERTIKFKEATALAAKEVLLMERDLRYFYSFSEVIRKKLKMKVLIGEDAFAEAKKRFPPKTKIYVSPINIFELFPNFCIFDEEKVFIFTEAGDEAIYSENAKIIRLFTSLFKLLCENPNVL